jgi:hypothetical protein
VIAIILVFMPVIAQADSLSYTFVLIPPDGAVAGPQGSTVGWGYEITNESTTDWLLVTGVGASPFLNGTPDSSIFDLPILTPTAPGNDHSVNFNGNGGVGTQGLYQLTWDTTAPIGFVNSGTFTISAEWWVGDPSNGGTFVDVALLDPLDEYPTYSATVTAPAEATVPEPSTLLLVLPTLAVLGISVRMRRTS